MIELTDPPVQAFLTASRHPSDAEQHAPSFIDWLQEQGGTFADVLRLYAGLPDAEPTKHHTGGLPKVCVRAAAEVMTDSYPSAHPTIPGRLLDPCKMPAPARWVIDNHYERRVVGLPAVGEELVRMGAARWPDPRADYSFVGFSQGKQEVLYIHCLECSRRAPPPVLRGSSGWPSLADIVPRVALWRDRYSGHGWQRHYWIGRCDRCGWVGWAKEEDGAEDRDLRRRVLGLFAGLPVLQLRHMISEARIIASGGRQLPLSFTSWTVDELSRAGFRPELPFRHRFEKEARRYVFEQVITAEQLIPPEPWEHGRIWGPYADRGRFERALEPYGESPLRAAYRPWREGELRGEQMMQNYLAQRIEYRMAAVRSAVDRLLDHRITLREAIIEVRSLAGDEREALEWLEHEMRLRRERRASLPSGD